jgi:hypothetical protein
MNTLALSVERRSPGEHPATGYLCQRLRRVYFFGQPHKPQAILFPPPALGEGDHRGLARCLVAVASGPHD